MVILTVKKGDEPQFLFETTVTKSVDETVKECTEIYNGRLKVSRICFGEKLFKFFHKMCTPILDT